ncbi:hypothetical protein ACFS5N_06305 [Mucilaginibacter ximonensis]|uniref:Uncharacterized protein n=1 Tax=Mucilaginibacter ximonensis TaxID=538021 RepID=A0ABW5Y9V8_9SPHI
METTEAKDPKDEQITNEDTSVTNKDGDNDLEQGKQPDAQNNPDNDVDTVIPSTDDSGDPTAPKPEDEDTSNKGQGPKGENL